MSGYLLATLGLVGLGTLLAFATGRRETRRCHEAQRQYRAGVLFGPEPPSRPVRRGGEGASPGPTAVGEPPTRPGFVVAAGRQGRGTTHRVAPRRASTPRARRGAHRAGVR